MRVLFRNLALMMALSFAGAVQAQTREDEPPGSGSGVGSGVFASGYTDRLSDRIKALDSDGAPPDYSDLRKLRSELIQGIALIQNQMETSEGVLETLRGRKASVGASNEFSLSELQRHLRLANQYSESIKDQIAITEERVVELESDLANSRADEVFDLKQRLIDLQIDQGTYRADAEDFEQQIKQIKEQGGIASRFDAQIEAEEEKLTRLRRQLATMRDHQLRLDDMINTLLIPATAQNEFKERIATYFAGLVGMVIIGFFAISFRDEGVRRSIFSSQSGIQFLTLFSLVIAIILFGITGILGDKELAALLGGLSGYILGRVGTSEERAPAPAPAGAAPAAVAPVPQPAAATAGND